MRKKCVALFMLFVMVISVGGCGNNNKVEDVSAEEASYNYTGTGPITDKEDATLSMLAQNSWYTTVDYANAPILDEIIKRAGVTIDWQLLSPTNYNDSVSPMLAAGRDLPDIVQLPDLDENMNYIKSGLFVPLDDLIEQYGVNIKKYFDENPDVKASLTAEDGHVYYIPQGVLTSNYQPCLMINVEWLDSVGLEEPTTIDAFITMLRAFRDNDPNGNGEADEIPMSIQSKFVPYLFGPGFGLDLVSGFYADEDNKVHYGYYEDNYYDYLVLLHDLYEEGLLETEFASLSRDQIISRFSQDITGVTFDFSWQMSQAYSSLYASYTGEAPIVKGVAPLSGPKGEGFYVGRNAVSGIFGISSNSSNPALALKFLDLAMSEEAQDLYHWGFEGETYEVVDGQKVYTEKAKDNEYLQGLGINAGNMPSRQSVEATDVLLPKWHVEIDKELEGYMKAPWPFIYSTQDESDVISQYMTDITTYVEEMNIKYITGTEDLSTFDTYIETLENMNIGKILEIKQNQYDRFVEATK